jgi:nucleotide-binding universal stress UspA family protein
MKILLAADGSDHSTKAARYLARHWPARDTVTLLSVDLPLTESIARWLDAETIARFHADNGKAALKAARRILNRAGRPFKEQLLVGDPATEIVELARKGGYELIIMGSHGRGIIKNLFLGSVVTKVLSTSRVPVLVVR